MPGRFAPRFIDLIQHLDSDFQTCARVGFLHQLPDRGDTVKHDSLAGTRHMAKDAVLNRIVLGTIGRIVSDPDFQPGPVRQCLQVLLKERGLRWIAAAAIPHNQQLLRIRVGAPALVFPPPGQAVAGKFRGVAARAQMDMGFIAANIIDAMRNHFALALTGEVMIEHFNGFLRVQLSLPVEIPQQLLFLGVDADDRLPHFQIV